MLVLALYFPILWPVNGCLWITLFREDWVIFGLSISGAGITSGDVGLFSFEAPRCCPFQHE